MNVNAGIVVNAPSLLVRRKENNMERKFLIDDFIHPCDGCEDYKSGVCRSKGGCGRKQTFSYNCRIKNDRYCYELDYKQLSNYNLERITCDLIKSLYKEMDGDEKMFFLFGLTQQIHELTEEYLIK